MSVVFFAVVVIRVVEQRGGTLRIGRREKSPFFSSQLILLLCYERLLLLNRGRTPEEKGRLWRRRGEGHCGGGEAENGADSPCSKSSLMSNAIFWIFFDGAFEKRRKRVVNRSFLRGGRRRRRPQQLWKRSGASIHFKCPWRRRPRRRKAYGGGGAAKERERAGRCIDYKWEGRGGACAKCVFLLSWPLMRERERESWHSHTLLLLFLFLRRFCRGWWRGGGGDFGNVLLLITIVRLLPPRLIAVEI